MHKKLIMFMVIISLFLTFSGCNNGSAEETTSPTSSPEATATIKNEVTGQEVVKLLSTTTDTSRNLEFDTDYVMDMSMSSPGLTMDMKFSGNVKFKSVDDKPQYYMTMETDMFGIKSDMLMVMSDGKAYYEIDGEGMAMEVGDSEIIELKEEFNMGTTPDIPEGAVKSFTVKKDGDNTVYDIVLDGSKLEGLADDYIEDPSVADVFQYDDCKAIITLDSDNNPVDCEMIANFSSTVEDQTTEYNFKMSFKFNSFKDVEIDLSKLEAE